MENEFIQFERVVTRGLLLGHVFATIVLGYLPICLALNGETIPGRLIGIAAIFCLLIPLALWLLLKRQQRRAGYFTIASLTTGALVAYTVASIFAPSGKSADANLTQDFYENAKFRATSLANMVPEIDQLKLGTYLFEHLDPFINGQKAENLRNNIVKIYKEARSDPEFVQVGSSLGYCYNEIIGDELDFSHCYIYIPKHLGRDQYPALIFLHGSLGNFKAYLWILKSIADTEGFAIIAPTYGAGNWNRDIGQSVLKRTKEMCKSNPLIDEERLFLGGISNGGKGVTREIAANGNQYKGFLLISPVLEDTIMQKVTFAQNILNKPILLLHGETDRRIPLNFIQYAASTLKIFSDKVTFRIYPDQDHFLFFNERDWCSSVIREWIQQYNILDE